MSKDKENKGLIYIMTNPSFPNYQKIGKTTDLKKRKNDLNKNTCLPYSFRVFATYEVDDDLEMVEYEIHNLIDTVDFTLRAREETESGKKREREFFAMDAESAYSILESIANLRGDPEKLKLENRTEEDIKEEAFANHVEKMVRRKFQFSKKGIPIGSTICFVDDETITADVVGDMPPKVSFEGIDWLLSPLVGELKKRNGTSNQRSYQGAAYFKYKGVILTDMPDADDIID